jgi:nicotinate phosphoribosyltransferase
MAVSALEGVEHANRETLDIWYDVYKGALGVALTDTFTTEVFLRDFDFDLANKYTGVRQDSGNPYDFTNTMVDHYKSIGIDPATKVIVFSDALTAQRAIELYDHTQKAGIKASFGIGTSLTNDFQKTSDLNAKSKALNIVIKLKECNGKRVIKLSDDSLKHSADAATISAFKQELGINQ